MSFQEAIHFFLPAIEVAECNTLSRGKVNDTWLIKPVNGRPVILQRLPVTVFSDPQVVMNNIQITTDHLHRFFIGQDDEGMTFYTLHTNQDGQPTYIDEEGSGWRIISYIPRSRTIEPISTPGQGFEIGRALGLFHRATLDLASSRLTDPLPGLHDTPGYLTTYNTISSGYIFKTCEEQLCRSLIEQLKGICSLLHAPAKGFSTSIIHGDPKVSNFLFAQNEDRVISIIDLDTVKPGLLLHDLGDCLRSCCNLQGEERPAYQQTVFDRDVFQAVLDGYEKNAGMMLSTDDIRHLVDATKLICFELGLRFFTDHLQGDVYFKTNKPGQNLHRALVQFHLAASIEQQEVELGEVVENIFRKNQSGITQIT